MLGSWRDLERISWIWFAVMFLLQLGSLACLWWLQRMALHRARWRDVIESQLAGNALGKIAPAGGAIGAALQYRMLVESGLERGRTVAGITAVNLLTFAVVLALPILVLPTFLRGSVDRTLVEATLLGVGVFTLLSGAAVALLAFDRPLELVGRAVQSVRNKLRRGSEPHTGMPERLRRERDKLIGTLGPRWKEAVVGDRRSLGLRLREPARGAGRGRRQPAALAGAARLLRRAGADPDPGHPRRPRLRRGGPDRDAGAGGCRRRPAPSWRPSPTGCSPTGCRCPAGLGASSSTSAATRSARPDRGRPT